MTPAEAMPGLPPGYRLLAFDSLASTNATALERAAAGDPAGTVIWAQQQTSGRGRRGRHWESFAGNLYASILLRPACKLTAAAQLGFVAAVAVVESVTALAPTLSPLALKWPNDVLLGGRKVAGVLLESQAGGGEGDSALAIGVGVNIAGFPDIETVSYPATALHTEAAAAHIEADALLSSLVRCFEAGRARWAAEGFGPVRAAWLARAKGLGKPIAVRLPRESRHGIFQDLDDSGALCLATSSGRIERITVGEVFFGRA